MRMPKFARKLLSITSAKSFWGETPRRKTNNVRPQLESLESRVVPAVDAVQNGAILTIGGTNDNADNIGIIMSNNGGSVQVQCNVKFTASPGGNVTTFTAAAGTQLVLLTGKANGKFFDMTVNDLTAVTNIKTINYFGSDVSDVVNIGANQNANIYFQMDALDGDNSITLSKAGVNVLIFSDDTNSANNTDTLNLDPNNTKVALDFAQVTAEPNTNLGANVNLTLSAGAGVLPFANYRLRAVQLAANNTATKISAVYGSQGNDSIIGNELANALIGFGGSDTLLGNGGGDELAATRDFSPAIAGTVTNGIAATGPTTIVDLSKFTTAQTQFNSAAGVSQTSKDLYGAFGFFNFGEGGSFAASGTVNFTADFAAANAVVVTPATLDLLFGGEGNDGLFGFNNAAVSASGQNGNDVFSANSKGLPSTYDGGPGNDLLIGNFGTSLYAGEGNDTLSYVGDPATVNLLFYALGGSGNDSIDMPAGTKFLTIDTGIGVDTLNINQDDASNSILFNTATVGFNPAILTKTNKIQRTVLPTA